MSEMKKKNIGSQRRNKLKQFLLIAAVVLIGGGIFSAGWFLNARSTLPESATSPPSTELPPSPYLPEVPRISAEEVKVKLDAGINLVIIDSRSKTTYEQSHITGAISIPITTMAEPYSHLDRYDEIITYCNWPDEQESARAVQKLIEAGYSNAKAVEGGIVALKKAGFSVEGTSN